MHDPKFEKDVQQKLQELSFSPSDAVWNNVARAVNGDRKRRTPVFWLWMLPAVALTVGGIWYFAGKGSPAPVAASSTLPSTSSAASPALSATQHTTLAATPQTAPSTTPQTALSATHNPATRPALSATQPALSAVPSNSYATPSSSSRQYLAAARHKNKNTPFHKEDQTENIVNTEPPFSSTTANNTATHTLGTNTTAAHTGAVSLPALKTLNRQYASPGAARPSSRSLAAATAAKTTIQLEPKHSWETGFGGGIGMSSINKTLFQQPVVMSDLRPNGVVINGAPKAFSSQVKPDLSWWAGIVAERQLNKRLTLALGLSLHYYSAKIQTGEKVVNPPQNNYAAQSLFTPYNNQAQAAAYPYYSVGNTDAFTNRYYFLELPASVLWQINHSRTLPIFWEGGVSFSYLVSSTALYYNSKSSAFFKDGGMANKFQANLATALLVGLPVRGIRLQAGPQIQYGVTSLQNEGSTGQHLFYGGLRVIVLPGKGKK